jgi:hypothetical protein
MVASRAWALRGPLVAALVALVFAAVLFGRGHPYDADQLSLALPYARILRDAVHEHRFPLWTTLVWCGYPVHAEGQGGFLAFPFRIVTIFAPDEVTGVELEIALVLVLAAFSGALAARLLGRSHEAAATAGILWALGGGLLAYQENPAVLEACWSIPLLVALGRREERAAPLVAAALLGLMLLAGWPYAFLLVLPLLIFTWHPRRLALILALGVAIGAVQLLPTAELFTQSNRAGGLAPAEVLGQAALAPGDLARIVSPVIPPEQRLTSGSVVFAYLGIPAVLLAFLGCVCSVRERHYLFPATLVVALVLALLPALAPDLAAKLVSVPPLSIVRGPSKLLILLGLAASFLAAEGVDAIPKQARLAFLLVALDLFQFGQRKALIVDREVPRTIPEVARTIPPGARTHSVNALYVPWARDLDAVMFRAMGQLDPNTNVLAGVSLVGGYDPLPVARSFRLAKEPTFVHLERAGAELLVTPDQAMKGLEPVARFATRRLYRLPAHMPLARLATEAVVASSSDAAFELAGRTSPLVAVLEEPLPGPIEDGDARVEKQREDRLEVAVKAKGPALLVVAMTYYPGWEASVDGVPTRILRADYAFLAVPLPAGAREVTLVYRPTTFRAGLALSALGLVALFLLAMRLVPGRLRNAKATT